MEERELLALYVEALRLACDNDCDRGIELLTQAAESLNMDLPVIACEILND